MVNRVEIREASSSEPYCSPLRFCCRTHDPTGSGEICIINNTPTMDFNSAVKFIPGIAKDANTVELIDELISILKYYQSLFS